MVVAISMWSIDIVPGKKFNLPVERDFRITNACLGELVDETGRSLVKVEVDEANDDSEDEDEDSVETWKTVLCSLRAGQTEQATLDITFLEGQQVSFEVTGKNTVYLSGNYIDQDEGADMPPFGDEDDEDSDLDVGGPGYRLQDVSSDVEMDPREIDALVGQGDESDDEDRFEEVSAEAEPDSKKRPRPSDASADEKLSKAQRKKLAKKLKADDGSAVPAGKTEKSKSGGSEQEKAKGKADEKKSKTEKSKPKTDDKPKGKTGEEEKPKGKKAAGEPKTLAGGLIIQDVVLGTGPGAKKGQKLSMRYIGKFSNGKVFDKNTGGPPFSFKLGRGDVIKGWDQGLVGMQPGGERLLTIPGHLAYGSSPPSGIPKNATLIFEVKLLSAV